MATFCCLLFPVLLWKLMFNFNALPADTLSNANTMTTYPLLHLFIDSPEIRGCMVYLTTRGLPASTSSPFFGDTILMN